MSRAATAALALSVACGLVPSAAWATPPEAALEPVSWAELAGFHVTAPSSKVASRSALLALARDEGAFPLLRDRAVEALMRAPKRLSVGGEHEYIVGQPRLERP